MKLGPITITRHSFAFQRKRGFFNAGTWRHWNFGYASRRMGVVTIQWIDPKLNYWRRTHDTYLKIDVADKSVEVFITYSFTSSSLDSYDASRGGPGGWDPGDPAEVDIYQVEVVWGEEPHRTYEPAPAWLVELLGNSDLVFEKIADRHERDHESSDCDHEDR